MILRPISMPPALCNVARSIGLSSFGRHVAALIVAVLLPGIVRASVTAQFGSTFTTGAYFVSASSNGQIITVSWFQHGQEIYEPPLGGFAEYAVYIYSDGVLIDGAGAEVSADFAAPHSFTLTRPLGTIITITEHAVVWGDA